MHPICFEIGDKVVHWYGVLVSIAFLIAIIHWTVRAHLDGFPEGFGLEMGFWMMVCGIVGGRIAHVAAHWSFFQAHPSHILRFDEGGLIFYGGLIGAGISVIVLCLIRRQPFWAAGDVAISGLPLGHAIGRLGCFLNGCCFGTPSSLPWAVHYPEGSRPAIQAAGSSVHPVQIYELLLNLFIYALIWAVYGKRKKDGSVVVLYLLTYSIVRFALEFIRGDERTMIGPLTVAQGVSVALFCVGIALFVLLPKRRALQHG